MKRMLLTLLLLASLAPRAHAQTTEALLDTVQASSFRFFWYEATPNGLIRDRSQPGSPCSIASLGFGLSAICVGIDHGWVTRGQGAARVLAALQTLWNAPQDSLNPASAGYRGLYYHFLNMNTAAREWGSELSTIDTALLFAGILDCRQYFTANEPGELSIRSLADSITRRADWRFMQPNYPADAGIAMGWKPESGFSGFGTWVGYNEAMILYLIALGSPTHPVVGNAWARWTSGYNWQTKFGYTYVIFPPLFGHQYSHCWVDFRLVRDTYMTGKGITYFENSRRATLAQRAYCIANALHFTGYGDSLWGITAGDGPSGYTARGAPPFQNDDGTISPTAPVSSIPFAPDECIAATRNIYNLFHDSLWGPYGFRDAFNLTRGWWDADYLGIDQGPMVLMIENYRTGKVWNRMMENPDIQRGLNGAGFTAVASAPPPAPPGGLRLEALAPDPARTRATVRFTLAAPAAVRLSVYDLQGREVARLAEGRHGAGAHSVPLDASRLSPGVYLMRLESGTDAVTRRFVRLR